MNETEKWMQEITFSFLNVFGLISKNTGLILSYTPFDTDTMREANVDRYPPREKDDIYVSRIIVRQNPPYGIHDARVPKTNIHLRTDTQDVFELGYQYKHGIERHRKSEPSLKLTDEDITVLMNNPISHLGRSLERFGDTSLRFDDNEFHLIGKYGFRNHHHVVSHIEFIDTLLQAIDSRYTLLSEEPKN